MNTHDYDRLNAEMLKAQDDELIARGKRIAALEAENAAMREIVEAVAHFNDHEQWATLGDGSRARYRNCCEWCDGVPIEDAVFARLAHTADCPVIKARALLGIETE